MRLVLRTGCFLFFGTVLTGVVHAQSAAKPTIYTCVDADGRRYTADRPITNCVDREQRVLGATGVERKIVGPSLTEAEQTRKLEAQRELQQQRQKERAQQRADAMLLNRYPSRAHHEAKRSELLASAKELQEKTIERVEQLQRENKKLQQEWDRYRRQDVPIPGSLQFSLQEGLRELKEKNEQIKAHKEEMNRINERFDEELERLIPLWEHVPL